MSGKVETLPVKISVIIAARNEAENIPGLLDSLDKIDYPQSLFEVIIVDDNSSDNTFKICENYASNYKFLRALRNPDQSATGKRQALEFGIANSQNDFILITDADCRPEKNWLKCYSDRFNDGEMFFGIAPFFQEKFFVNKISCFENLRNSILSFSMTEIGLSYTSAARNLGFSKTAFEKIGGYSKTNETLSGDDDFLIREAVKNKLKIRTVADKGSAVFSKTKKTLKEYLSQRSRHTQSSFYYLIRHKLILGIWHLVNLFFLFSPLLATVDTNFLILLPAKLLIDLIIISINQKKFRYAFKWYEVILLQICYEILLIIHFFNARFTKVKWK